MSIYQDYNNYSLNVSLLTDIYIRMIWVIRYWWLKSGNIGEWIQPSAFPRFYTCAKTRFSHFIFSYKFVKRELEQLKLRVFAKHLYLFLHKEQNICMIYLYVYKYIYELIFIRFLFKDSQVFCYKKFLEYATDLLVS